MRTIPSGKNRLMNEKAGEVFSIGKDNAPIPGCTISKKVSGGKNSIMYFSLAENTDISAEIYPYSKFIITADGDVTVYGDSFRHQLSAGDCILTPTDIPIGIRTSKGAVYTEICMRRDDIMNDAVKAGTIFRLPDLVPYQDGKIVNMDVMHNEHMKFVVMAFDEGTGLAEHAAPGEALIFALDGDGIIGYERKEHPVKAGENFHFAKGGLHYVKAVSRFKMALLLTLE